LSPSLLGKSIPRTDARGKVLGRDLYPGDLARQNMLHLKVVFADRPHARILEIDPRKAAEVPGVAAVLTAEDVPVNEYGFVVPDQPVLCGDIVRFVGDQVAVVVAESEEIASQARDLIQVRYADLPAVFDARAAARPGAPVVHAACESNILEHMPIRKGDVAAGFARADVIVSGTYTLPMQEHAFMAPEAGLAYMDGDQIVVETAGQWAHHDQRQIARALDIPERRVRVIYRAIGGAFGGREDVSVQIILALAALKTRRPVKVVWTRGESIRGHCKRHQMSIHARWGADARGKLLAAEAEIFADAGAYACTTTMVHRQTALTCTGAYEIPHVRVDSYAVYTNNIPGGALRGFGSPQGIFVAEMQIEKLAAALRMDPVEIRRLNLLRERGLLSVGTPLPQGIRLERMLERCAREAGWGQAKWRPRPTRDNGGSGSPLRRGVGFAIGLKNVGFSFGYQDESTATVELHGGEEIERVLVRYAGAELGQGALTSLRQIAAQALGLPLRRVEMINADTELSPEASSASASRLTLMGGGAILGAAQQALRDWRGEGRPAVARYTYKAPETTPFEPETGHSLPNFSYSPIAQVVELLVDLETGQLTFDRVLTVVDVGRAINPQLIQGQVEGAVVQGIGYAAMENFITQQGQALTADLSTYLIPTVLDVPNTTQTVILEEPDPVGPWGARGLAEAPLVAIAPAVAAAIHDALGVWIDRLPILPEVVLKALGERTRCTRDERGVPGI
jgi:CO/xanthine dehydrogenase Mo-binding subunit